MVQTQVLVFEFSIADKTNKHKEEAGESFTLILDLAYRAPAISLVFARPSWQRSTALTAAQRARRPGVPGGGAGRPERAWPACRSVLRHGVASEATCPRRPRALTTLKLPDYGDDAELRRARLLTALREGQGAFLLS